jgi:hypothetical protein
MKLAILKQYIKVVLFGREGGGYCNKQRASLRFRLFVK